MAIVENASATGLVEAGKQQSWIRTNWGLVLAIAALVAILLLPTPAELPLAGHRMLAVLTFAVIIRRGRRVRHDSSTRRRPPGPDRRNGFLNLAADRRQR
jgi:hypothetical protein